MRCENHKQTVFVHNKIRTYYPSVKPEWSEIPPVSWSVFISMRTCLHLVEVDSLKKECFGIILSASKAYILLLSFGPQSLEMGFPPFSSKLGSSKHLIWTLSKPQADCHSRSKSLKNGSDVVARLGNDLPPAVKLIAVRPMRNGSWFILKYLTVTKWVLLVNTLIHRIANWAKIGLLVVSLLFCSFFIKIRLPIYFFWKKFDKRLKTFFWPRKLDFDKDVY